MLILKHGAIHGPQYNLPSGISKIDLSLIFCLIATDQIIHAVYGEPHPRGTYKITLIIEGPIVNENRHFIGIRHISVHVDLVRRLQVPHPIIPNISWLVFANGLQQTVGMVIFTSLI